MRIALDAALKVRQVFCKYDFVQEQNAAGYTVNATDQQFIQNGGGMCRDFVCQQAKMLKRMRNIPSFDSLLFVPVDEKDEWMDEKLLHSFTVIHEVDGSVYMPESTLDCLKGVWYFPTLTDCITAVRIGLGLSSKVTFHVYSYMGDDPDLVGMNRAETVDYIRAHGLPLPHGVENRQAIYEGLRVGG